MLENVIEIKQTGFAFIDFRSIIIRDIHHSIVDAVMRGVHCSLIRELINEFRFVVINNVLEENIVMDTIDGHDFTHHRYEHKVFIDEMNAIENCGQTLLKRYDRMSLFVGDFYRQHVHQHDVPLAIMSNSYGV